MTYTSRPLQSDAYQQNMSEKRIVVGEFGTASFCDPCKSLFQRYAKIKIAAKNLHIFPIINSLNSCRIQATFEMLRGNAEMTDNCNVSVAYFGDQLYALRL